MNIEQLYTGCLSQGAYFISSKGEAAVIDPLREITQYLDLAKQSNSKIKYIFETHFHADFVSGHVELAEATGATIVYGPNAMTRFASHIGADNEIYELGELKIRMLHTPGHTLESCCYLLEDEHNQPRAIFTGDTLFIGDVGRPDLAQQPVEGLSQNDLAGMLFDSLRNKILPLPDNVVIYPAHGAGSACGKNMSKETFDTLGNQRRNNYALNTALSRHEFIIEVTTGLKPAPAYFPMNVRMNIQGSSTLSGTIKRSLLPIQPAEVQLRIKLENVMVLDTRNAQDFSKAHIPGAINIGLSGSFAPWVGALIPFEKVELLIVTELGKEEETVSRLARIGYENVTGYLMGGMDHWIAAGLSISTVQCISPEEFLKIQPLNPSVIDVRNDSEYQGGHITGSIHVSLAEVESLAHLVETGQTYYVYCAGGYRSMVFISLMKSKMNVDLINIEGGYNAIASLLN
jgi:hydroxyacylglutathione hydrolase